MRTVTVRMHAADLSSQMAGMRDWLDRHRYAPTRFVYDQTDTALIISVEFPNDLEGERSQGASTAKSRANRC